MIDTGLVTEMNSEVDTGVPVTHDEAHYVYGMRAVTSHWLVPYSAILLVHLVCRLTCCRTSFMSRSAIYLDTFSDVVTARRLGTSTC